MLQPLSKFHRIASNPPRLPREAKIWPIFSRAILRLNADTRFSHIRYLKNEKISPSDAICVGFAAKGWLSLNKNDVTDFISFDAVFFPKIAI